MAANGFLGAGDVYVNTIIAGVATGWQGPFPAAKFEIKADSELKEQISRGRSTYGQVDESVPVPKPFELSVEFTRFDKTGMSLALMGTVAALSQASGALANDAVTITKDKWTPLSKANLSGPVVIKDAAAAVTYVEGTDYLLNREMGWIYVLTGSVIADGATLKVSGNYLAITGSLVKGATLTSVRAKIRFNGINFADGLPVIVDVKEAVITSKAALDFLADNFARIPLTGRMKTPAGATEPFTVEMRDA